MSELNERIEKHLTNNGPIILMKSPRGEFMASSEWGEEAPDSPMVGAAAYGLGESYEEAVTQVLDQAGVR